MIQQLNYLHFITQVYIFICVLYFIINTVFQRISKQNQQDQQINEQDNEQIQEKQQQIDKQKIEQTQDDQEQFEFTGILSFLNDGVPMWFEVVSGVLCFILLIIGIAATRYDVQLGLPFLILVMAFSLTWFYFLYRYQEYNPQAPKNKKKLD